MRLLSLSGLVLSVLAACSGSRDTGPIETAATAFQCTLDNRFDIKTVKTIPIEPFSFSATLLEGGRSAEITRDGRTFRARYWGILTVARGPNNPRQKQSVQYMGRDNGGRVIVTVPKISSTTDASYTQFGRDQEITAFYRGKCS